MILAFGLLDCEVCRASSWSTWQLIMTIALSHGHDPGPWPFASNRPVAHILSSSFEYSSLSESHRFFRPTHPHLYIDSYIFQVITYRYELSDLLHVHTWANSACEERSDEWRNNNLPRSVAHLPQSGESPIFLALGHTICLFRPLFAAGLGIGTAQSDSCIATCSSDDHAMWDIRGK